MSMVPGRSGGGPRLEAEVRTARARGHGTEDPNLETKYGAGSPRAPARHAETQVGLGWPVLHLLV